MKTQQMEQKKKNRPLLLQVSLKQKKMDHKPQRTNCQQPRTKHEFIH